MDLDRKEVSPQVMNIARSPPEGAAEQADEPLGHRSIIERPEHAAGPQVIGRTLAGRTMSEFRRAPGAMRLPDVEAEIHFLAASEGGRTSRAISGYRPGHAVREDYITTGVHDYLDVEEARPGDTVRATITFIMPEAYPATLWVGKVVAIQEGSHVVGYATITKILNDILETAG